MIDRGATAIYQNYVNDHISSKNIIQKTNQQYLYTMYILWTLGSR